MIKALGLMSGTSLDGVDVALIETNGERIGGFGPTCWQPYSDGERALLRAALAAAVELTDRKARPGVLAEAEEVVTLAHANAVARFLAENDIAAADIAVIGFHGQTVLHRPDRKLTVQIGDGAALAQATGIGVVYDLRACDVEQGGQGAPLVPVYHRALVQRLGIRDPVAVVNIGGVANITYVDGDTLIACDVGPGNALLDDFMLARTGSPIDRGGAAAAAGRPDEGWIAEALKRPFFSRPPPKSLDRNDFADLSVDGMSVEDGAATLTAFTAAAIAAIAERLPKPPSGWIVAGGGARNPTLLAMLSSRLAPYPVTVASDHGWSADALEAQAFAFLAVRSMRALPLTYPSTTGVRRPTAGGELVHPQD